MVRSNGIGSSWWENKEERNASVFADLRGYQFDKKAKGQ
jgi:hypothetical protein